MAATDLAMLLYWSLAGLLQAGLIHMPAEWMYAHHDRPDVVAWNWSFLPLDLAFSGLGLAAVEMARRGQALWRSLALVSLSLTSTAGPMAVSYWTLTGEFDPAWFVPNFALMAWPLFFLPGLISGAAAARGDPISRHGRGDGGVGPASVARHPCATPAASANGKASRPAAAETDMTDLPADIFAEQEDLDTDTLANLGPLRALAGTWESAKGLDVNPFYDGDRRQTYVERIELTPIDPQSNGPQLLYGLRYHTHIVKPGEVETYHDQVGYWLWEPATGTILHSLTIPRGQTVLATGQATADATSFEVKAQRGSTVNGICSGPFLEAAFRTDSFRMVVTVNPDDTWSYFEDTVLQVAGREAPYHHTDRNTLTRVAAPVPNPLSAAGD